jgi:hypothetical protein
MKIKIFTIGIQESIHSTNSALDLVRTEQIQNFQNMINAYIEERGRVAKPMVSIAQSTASDAQDFFTRITVTVVTV